MTTTTFVSGTPIASSWLNDVNRKTYDELINVDAFSPTADGITDDLIPLTNFWNSAIANPGVPHFLNKATYACSGPLPTINVSNVIILGSGSDIHSVGTKVTGTVIKKIGSANTSPIIEITAVSGASNQRISNVSILGVGLDCNNLAGVGIRVYSAFQSNFDCCIADATIAGFAMGVVASLGEAKDNQRNRIRLRCQQYVATNGFCVFLDGDSVANTSLNDFQLDMAHTNVQALYCVNTDNNDYHYVRAFKAPSGTATESIALLGGATSALTSRAERFHFLTSTMPLRVYGTEAYTVASKSHQIFCLDTENGTPAPTIGTGSTLHYRYDISGLSDDVWTSYTPTVSSFAGTINSASATGSYARRGKIMYVKIQISITTNGTGATTVQASLPVGGVGAMGSSFVGLARTGPNAGKAIVGFSGGGGLTNIDIRLADGTYPGSDNTVLFLEGFYEVT